MTADLVQRLRTCSAEERRAVAIELAKTGTDEAVTELARMVEADVMNYTPRTHRTIWQRRPIFYSYEDQLIGVTALGETRSQKALYYLESIYQPHYSEITDSVEVCAQSGCDPSGYPDYWSEPIQIEVTKFPKIKGELRKRLEYKIKLENVSPIEFNIRMIARERIPKEMIEHKRKQIFDKEPHKTMINSIRFLRTAIQCPT